MHAATSFVGPVVTVAVLTFDRVDHLSALLPLLVAQAEQLDARHGGSTTVLVVDNHPARTGEPVARRNGSRVRYVHEQIPGIAAGRARAVAEARLSDVLVFIDDDERPVTGWLEHLVSTWMRYERPAGVAGRVQPVWDGPGDPWIEAGGFFRRRQYPTGTLVEAASSANLLLSLVALSDRGLTFEVGLGLRGGEDTLLTRSLTGSGGRLVWCNEALVHDLVPPERMRRSWVLRRAFTHGAVSSRVALRTTGRGGWLARVRLLVGGAGRVPAGLLLALVGVLTRDLARRARGWRMTYRGAGLCLGALGRDVVEYRRVP